MPSALSIREFIGDRLSAAAEEICRHFEETISRYEEELCRQRRLLDICLKPRVQLHQIGLPQHFLCRAGDGDGSDQRKDKAEGPCVKQEQDELHINRGEERLAPKLETETLMVTPAQEGDEHGEADPNGPALPSQGFVVIRYDQEERRPGDSPSLPDGKTRVRRSGRRRHKEDSNNSAEITLLLEEVLSGDEDVQDQGKEETEPLRRTRAGEEFRPSREGEQPDPNWNAEASSSHEETGDDDGDSDVAFEGSALSRKAKGRRCREPKGKRKKDSGKPSRSGSEEHGDLNNGEEKPRSPDTAESPTNVSELKGRGKHRGKKLLSCIECEKRFLKISSLEKHMANHTGEKPYACKECDNTYYKLSSLKKHMRFHREDKQYSCKECGKQWNRRFCLIRHMKSHTKEKPFACERCDRSFGEKYSLIQHMKIHTGAKPFCCDDCGKSFHRRFAMMQHKMLHTGEKPFCCEECGKCFRLKTSMKAHMLVHREERPFRCDKCDKTFRFKSNCMYHRKSHAREKSFSCEECGESFSQRAELKSHQCSHTTEAQTEESHPKEVTAYNAPVEEEETDLNEEVLTQEGYTLEERPLRDRRVCTGKS